MQKRVSLKDIANKVGVSSALVSYVLNGKEKEKRIGKDIAIKIREAAIELNYQPNHIARSLRTKSTNTIGLIVADIANPFFSQLARIIENEATKNGYTLIIGSSDEDPGKLSIMMDSFFNRQVDGFIIVPTEGSVDQLSKAKKKGVPMVLIDRYFPELNFNYVILNNFQATYSATSRLIEDGLKNISLFAYKSSLIHMKERIRGYQEAMTQAGLNKNVDVIEVQFDFQEEEIEKAIHRIFKRSTHPEGLIFATNSLAISGLYKLRDSCIKIPKDVSFIGFDGGDSFELYYPPLSYIKQPLDEIGWESFNLLRDLMKGSAKTSQITLSPVLVIRDPHEC